MKKNRLGSEQTRLERVQCTISPKGARGFNELDAGLVDVVLTNLRWIESDQCTDEPERRPLLLGCNAGVADLDGRGDEVDVHQRVDPSQEIALMCSTCNQVRRRRTHPMRRDGPGDEAQDFRVECELLFQREGVPTAAVAKSGAEGARSPSPGVIHLHASVQKIRRVRRFPGLVLGRQHQPTAAHGTSSGFAAGRVSIASTAWRYS